MGKQGLQLGDIKPQEPPRKKGGANIAKAITGDDAPRTTVITARLPEAEELGLLAKLESLQETNKSRRCNKNALIRAAIQLALKATDRRLNNIIKELE